MSFLHRLNNTENGFMKTKSFVHRLIVCIFLVQCFLLTGISGNNFSYGAVTPDSYEPDNSYDQAKVIILNYDTPQRHYFHEDNDEDWVMFYALEGETYKIKTDNLSYPEICDPVIELFESDGITRVGDTIGVPVKDGEKSLLWTCPLDKEGLYYVRITNSLPNYGGSFSYSYDLSIDIPGAFTLPGYVTGTVSSGGQGLGGAVLKAGSGSGLSQSNGSYVISMESGPVTVSVFKSGYHPTSFSINVPGGGAVSRNVELVPISNSPPNISGLSDTTVKVGEPFRLVPVASDPNGDAITFSVEGKPAWMNFDTATGALSGTPGIEHIGQHGPITITATDYFGASQSLAPFTIDVKAVMDNVFFLPAIFHILLQ